MLPPVASLFFAAAAVTSSTSPTTTSTTATNNMSPSSIKLTYFDIEGAAEPTRLAFLLAGVAFEDVRVKFPEWQAMKAATPFGQLPTLQVGDDGPLMAQSGAMMRYAGSLSTDGSMYPTDKLLEVEQALGVTDDLNRAFSPGLYMGMAPKQFGYEEGSNKTEEGKKRTEAIRTAFVKDELPKYLGFYEQLLTTSGGDWLVAGDKPTIADCFAVPNLRRFTRGFMDAIPRDCLETHPKVVAYLERFCALPEMAGRYEDDGVGGTK